MSAIRNWIKISWSRLETNSFVTIRSCDCGKRRTRQFWICRSGQGYCTPIGTRYNIPRWLYSFKPDWDQSCFRVDCCCCVTTDSDAVASILGTAHNRHHPLVEDPQAPLTPLLSRAARSTALHESLFHHHLLLLLLLLPGLL